MKPLVTIVTVTYNSSAYIRDAVQSVLAQDYLGFEYVIADDCSIDDTWSIVNEYKDSRIIAFRNENNLGEYANRNKAISMATGKYLLFIDGDDILLKHGLGYFVSMAERFPEAAMIIQKNYLNNVVFPALIGSREVIMNHYFSETDLLSSSFASNFFRTDVLKEVGMLSTKYKGGDNHIRCRIAAKYPVLFIAGWCSWPRETPGSASSRLTEVESMVEVIKYTEELRNADTCLSQADLDIISVRAKYKLARIMQRSLVRCNFSALKFIEKETGLSIKDVFSLRSKNRIEVDFLKKYTPVSPYKSDFLK
jgi:glycosyltransferase involved in cell wall biosynthesis